MRVSPRILIPLVCLIWGSVGWRYLQPSLADSPVSAQAPIGWAADTSASQDTFSLRGGYRDPFLGEILAKHPAPSSLASAAKTSSRVRSGLRLIPPPSPPLPQIQFLGRVQGPDSLRTTALIRFENRSYPVQVGDSLGGMQVNQINAEGLVLVRADTLITIQ